MATTSAARAMTFDPSAIDSIIKDTCCLQFFMMCGDLLSALIQCLCP